MLALTTKSLLLRGAHPRLLIGVARSLPVLYHSIGYHVGGAAGCSPFTVATRAPFSVRTFATAAASPSSAAFAKPKEDDPKRGRVTSGRRVGGSGATRRVVQHEAVAVMHSPGPVPVAHTGTSSSAPASAAAGRELDGKGGRPGSSKGANALNISSSTVKPASASRSQPPVRVAVTSDGRGHDHSLGVKARGSVHSSPTPPTTTIKPANAPKPPVRASATPEPDERERREHKPSPGVTVTVKGGGSARTQSGSKVANPPRPSSTTIKPASASQPRVRVRTPGSRRASAPSQVFMDPHSFVEAISKLRAAPSPANVGKALDMWGKLAGGRYGQGVRPDAHCVNVVLSVCAKAEPPRVDKGWELWQALQSGALGKGVSPDTYSVSSVLTLLAQASPPRVADAESVLAHVLDGGLEGVAVEPYAMCSMFTIYGRSAGIPTLSEEAKGDAIAPAKYLWSKAVSGAFGSSALNEQCANAMVSLLSRAGDVPDATEFWRGLVSGSYGKALAVPSTRAITSMLRMFAAHACPVQWSVGVLQWFLPLGATVNPSLLAAPAVATRGTGKHSAASGTDEGIGSPTNTPVSGDRSTKSSVQRPVPDARVITAAIMVFKRMHQKALCQEWVLALLPLCPLGTSSDKFVVSAMAKYFGADATVALLRRQEVVGKSGARIAAAATRAGGGVP